MHLKFCRYVQYLLPVSKLFVSKLDMCFSRTQSGLAAIRQNLFVTNFAVLLHH